MKKGQTEIIGIAVMTVLMIALVFIISPQEKKPEEMQDRYEIMALSSILRTSITCDGADMQVSDLARECVRPDCSCRDFTLNAILQSMLNESDYAFEIVKEDSAIFEKITAECGKTSVVLPGEEKTEVRLGICQERR